jgi:RNA polymerase sigma-70 factor (ECF subfamily)
MSFPSTHWNLLAQARQDESVQSRKALEALCGRYWGPIHTFIRARSIPDPEAQDLTQDFMVQLLRNSFFSRGDRLRGRFRSFLLGALVRFLADAADKQSALKRGGGREHLSMDNPDFIELEATSSAAGPARSFDREWALTILESSLERLRTEYSQPRRAELFGTLKQFLLGTAELPAQSETAELVGISVPALKSEVHRMRRRFRELVRDEVAQTVAAPHEIEAELAHLQSVLADRSWELAWELQPRTTVS